jgi:hypothetical protein
MDTLGIGCPKAKHEALCSIPAQGVTAEIFVGMVIGAAVEGVQPGLKVFGHGNLSFPEVVRGINLSMLNIPYFPI